jgi:formylglycine-generating enzyme required for sulfatase activity
MHWVLISFFRKLVDRATNTRVDSCGRTLYGHNGGIWEWTSTDFEGLPGFETSEVYPGYSTDFFDGLHKVVVSPPHLLL